MHADEGFLQNVFGGSIILDSAADEGFQPVIVLIPNLIQRFIHSSCSYGMGFWRLDSTRLSHDFVSRSVAPEEIDAGSLPRWHPHLRQDRQSNCSRVKYLQCLLSGG